MLTLSLNDFPYTLLVKFCLTPAKVILELSLFSNYILDNRLYISLQHTLSYGLGSILLCKSPHKLRAKKRL